MVTLVLPLGQVSPSDEEERDALVARHRPGGKYSLTHPISSLCVSTFGSSAAQTHPGITTPQPQWGTPKCFSRKPAAAQPWDDA